MSNAFGLDAGHGGSDPGAQGNGLKEKDLNLKIVKKIDSLLDEYEDTKVVLTRDTDKTMSLDERTDLLNKHDVDFALSIHINASGGEGFESYIHDSLSNTSATSKARTVIHNEIMKQIGGKDRGKKKANFHMVRETKMQAVLTENLFIDFKGDADKLKQDSFLDKIAEGHVNGLVKLYNLKKKKQETPKDDTQKGDVHYRVVTGSFKEKKNAESRKRQLEKAGYESFIETKQK